MFGIVLAENLLTPVLRPDLAHHRKWIAIFGVFARLVECPNGSVITVEPIGMVEPEIMSCFMSNGSDVVRGVLIRKNRQPSDGDVLIGHESLPASDRAQAAVGAGLHRKDKRDAIKLGEVHRRSRLNGGGGKFVVVGAVKIFLEGKWSKDLPSG